LKEPGQIAVITSRNREEMRRLLKDHIESELPFFQRNGPYLYTIFLLKPVSYRRQIENSEIEATE